MKIRIVVAWIIFAILAGLFLYLFIPKNDFTPKDDIVLNQISFLINADICIKDFTARNGRIPQDLNELLNNYPDLIAIHQQFGNAPISIEYSNRLEDLMRIKISNSHSKLEMGLSPDGKIVKHHD